MAKMFTPGWYKQRTAKAKVLVAIKKGKLTRPSACELCGKDSGRIVGHHWRGYDYPLDVWWICSSCNSRLKNIHDGRLTKEDARIFTVHYVFHGGNLEMFRRDRDTYETGRLINPAEDFIDYGEEIAE